MLPESKGILLAYKRPCVRNIIEICSAMKRQHHTARQRYFRNYNIKFA